MKFALGESRTLKTFLGYRFSHFTTLFDLLIISGTIFLKWDPARLLAFYWIDQCVQLLFYISFMRFIGHLKLIFKLIVSLMTGFGLMCVYLVLIMKIATLTSPGLSDEVILLGHLFQPYYEVSFFIVLSGLGVFHFYNKIKTYKGLWNEIEFFIHMNCAISLFTIPVMLVLTSLLFALTLPTGISLAVSMAIVRNRLNAWQRRNIKKHFNEPELI